MLKQNMFCSNNTEINQIVLDHVVNPTSSIDQEHYHQNSLYLHNFPDPFLDNNDDLFFAHFLSQQQPRLFIADDCCWKEQEQEQERDHTTIDEVEISTKKKKSSNRKNVVSSRRGKKDRHSKICTAQGPRDRRMRLSLQIARKFFDLQDMLGFDKASKTIEWLLAHSNSAIRDLKNNSGFSFSGVLCSASSEVVSEINVGRSATKDEEMANAAAATTLNHKKERQLRTVARESRDRARARARQRTLLKKNTSISQLLHQNSSSFDFQDLNNSDPQDFPTSTIHHLSHHFPSIHSIFLR